MSASRKEGDLALTLVNPRHDTRLSVECGITGGTVSGAQAREIYHADLNACNTFEQPDTIVPRPLEVTVTASGSKIALDLPPMSVATVTARIA